MAKKEDTNKDVEVVEEDLPRSGRDIMIERIRTRYPDEEFGDDDDMLYSRYNDMYDELANENASMLDNNRKTWEFLNDNPKMGAVLAAIKAGAHPAVALRKYFDDDELAMTEDSPEYGEWLAAGEERKAQKEAHDALVREIVENCDISKKNIEEFAQENGLNEETVRNFISEFNDDVEKLSKGLMEKDYLHRLYKGYKHDDDILDAIEAGRIKGRNEKIEKELAKIEGDGLPEQNASATTREKEEMPTNDTLEALRNLNEWRKGKSKW